VIHITIEDHDYLLESFLDISERKVKESELQESEAKFRDLADRALSGYIFFRTGYFGMSTSSSPISAATAWTR